jgi:hypothetical protein
MARKVTAGRILEFLRDHPDYAELLERIVEFEEPRLPEMYPKGPTSGSSGTRSRPAPAR